MDQTQELTRRITELEQKLKLYEASNTIPLRFDQAMQGRGYLKSAKLIEFSALDFANTAATISLSGSAEDIDVMKPAEAWGYFTEGPFKKYIFPLYIVPNTY